MKIDRERAVADLGCEDRLKSVFKWEIVSQHVLVGGQN